MTYLLGEANAEEIRLVDEWLAANPENGNYYNQLKQVWEKSKLIAASSSVDTNAAWNRFQARTQVHKAKSRNSLFLRVAATVIFVIGAALLGIYLNDQYGNTPQMAVSTIEKTLIDTLPDGSVVTLNKKSSISYPKKFKGNTRKIQLKGEAFFNVSPDKTKPFVIDVKDIQVEVVGTSFNIRENKESTSVIVETGIVKVTKAGNTITLTAGEMMEIIDSGKIINKSKSSDKLYNYYRSKQFVCEDTPLWKLVQVLNEAYGSEIVITRSELKDLKINTTFNDASLDEILSVIHETFLITVTKKDNRILLQ
ncbi:MAG: FecR domain-containing protein [Chitinophagaceae bacterium]|nr:FecR domain-containing protein [Chitinophagaceae bacterium]